MKLKPIKKLYYSIGEVSKLTSLKQYVLRYWETEFSELRPAKNRAGNRIYRLDDIKLIFLIKKLLYEEKFTIEGARQQLQAIYGEKSVQMDIPFNEYSKYEFITELRKDLLAILDLLDHDARDDHQNDEDESDRGTKEEEVDYELDDNIVLEDSLIDRSEGLSFGA